MRGREPRPEPDGDEPSAPAPPRISGAYSPDYFEQALRAVRYKNNGELRDCFRDQGEPPDTST